MPQPGKCGSTHQTRRKNFATKGKSWYFNHYGQTIWPDETLSGHGVCAYARRLSTANAVLVLSLGHEKQEKAAALSRRAAFFFFVVNPSQKIEYQ